MQIAPAGAPASFRSPDETLPLLANSTGLPPTSGDLNESASCSAGFGHWGVSMFAGTLVTTGVGLAQITPLLVENGLISEETAQFVIPAGYGLAGLGASVFLLSTAASLNNNLKHQNSIGTSGTQKLTSSVASLAKSCGAFGLGAVAGVVVLPCAALACYVCADAASPPLIIPGSGSGAAADGAGRNRNSNSIQV